MKTNWFCRIFNVVPKKHYEALNSRLLEVSDELNERNQQLVLAANKFNEVNKQLSKANEKILLIELDKKLSQV